MNYTSSMKLVTALLSKKLLYSMIAIVDRPQNMWHVLLQIRPHRLGNH